METTVGMTGGLQVPARERGCADLRTQRTGSAEPRAEEQFPPGAPPKGPELGAEVTLSGDCALQPAKSEVADGGGLAGGASGGLG